MNVEVIPCPPEQKQVLKNLYVFWRYNRLKYLAAGPGSYVNAHGVIDGPDSRTHEESTLGEDGLWDRPHAIFPFLIRADEQLVGFAVVVGKGHCTRGRDWRMNDFFLLNRYRRQGIGRAAAHILFDRFPGEWEVGQLTNDPDSQAFWQKVIGEYTGGSYAAVLIQDDPNEPPYPGQNFRSGP